MKRYILFLTATFFISTAFQQQVVNGQDKSKADIEKEAKIQKSIDEQKKAMADQKKAAQELEENRISSSSLKLNGPLMRQTSKLKMPTWKELKFS